MLPGYPFKNNSSAGNYSGGYKSYGYNKNYGYNKSTEGYRGKHNEYDSSSIHSVSELFHVLLSGVPDQEQVKRSSLCRSSSEKVESHNVLMQKLLDPSSISWSLFDEVEEETFSENEAESSENGESELSSEVDNEEDFDEQEISELEEPKQSGVKNKDAYLKYLSSMNSTPLEFSDTLQEEAVRVSEKAPEDFAKSRICFLITKLPAHFLLVWPC